MKNKGNKEEPRVELFGEEIAEKQKKEPCGGVVMGVLLVFAGIGLLLNYIDALPWEFWDHVWRFWPSILILWGAGIILGNSCVSRFVMFILSVLIFGWVFLYGLAQVQSPVVDSLPLKVQNLLK